MQLNQKTNSYFINESHFYKSIQLNNYVKHKLNETTDLNKNELIKLKHNRKTIGIYIYFKFN